MRKWIHLLVAVSFMGLVAVPTAAAADFSGEKIE